VKRHKIKCGQCWSSSSGLIAYVARIDRDLGIAFTYKDHLGRVQSSEMPKKAFKKLFTKQEKIENDTEDNNGTD